MTGLDASGGSVPILDRHAVGLPQEARMGAHPDALVARSNADPSVHGILVQLPLPKHLSERAILDAISPAKDADGFHPFNVGALSLGLPRAPPPPPPPPP